MSQERLIARATRVTIEPAADPAAHRRLIEERLMVRAPGVYRRLAAILFRLPRKSRLRRWMIVRRIRRAYAAANRRDFDLILVGLDPHTEYRPGPDLIAPDQAAVFHGHDGYMAMWRNWLDAFGDLRFDPEEILDFGDTFLVSAQQNAHGSGSGAAVRKPVFQLFRIEAGLVVWQHDFGDRSEALEAVGPVQ